MVELDPRIVAVIFGAVLTFAGISIPNEVDIANQMKDDLKELYAGHDWCGENQNCKNTAKISIRTLETSLSAVEFQNNLSGAFFWLGLLVSGGSVVSLIKGQ